MKLKEHELPKQHQDPKKNFGFFEESSCKKQKKNHTRSLPCVMYPLINQECVSTQHYQDTKKSESKNDEELLGICMNSFFMCKQIETIQNHKQRDTEYETIQVKIYGLLYTNHIRATKTMKEAIC